MALEITCYLDDSHTGDGKVSVVAGYLVDAEAWETRFIPAWRDVLARAPKPLSEFKTSDCRHGCGEFADWTAEQRKALTVDLVSIVTKIDNLAGLSSALPWPGVPDPKAPDPVENRKLLEHGGYAVALAFCLLDMLRLGARVADSVQPIVDEKEGTFARMQEAFEMARRIVARHDGPSAAARLRSPRPADSRQLLPLQAADLLAYETGKEVLNRLEGRPVSRALERLVRESRGIHIARCLDVGSLDEYTASKAQGKGFPLKGHALLFRSDEPIRAAGLWGIAPMSN